MRFRLITYNIHKGIGGIDRRYRPERIVESVRHYEPDVVLLQEVDDGSPRSHHHRQVDVLGDALDLPYRVFQPNVRLKEGQYGNAILSRHPLTDIQDLDLTIPLKKRRRALIAHCRLRCEQHVRTLLLFNVHLGLAGFERTIQLRRLLASDVLQHTRHDTGVIVAGDYNDVWGTLGRRLLEPAGFKAGLFPSQDVSRRAAPCGPWTACTIAGTWMCTTASPRTRKSPARPPTTCRWWSTFC